MVKKKKPAADVIPDTNPISTPFWIKQTDLELLAGVSRETIRKWQGKGLPHLAPGKRLRIFDLTVVMQWIRTYDEARYHNIIAGLEKKIEELEAKDHADDDNYVSYRTRNELATAQLKELELKRKIGESVDFADVYNDLSTLGKRFRNRAMEKIKHSKKLEDPIMQLVTQFENDLKRDIQKHQNRRGTGSLFEAKEKQIDYCQDRTAKGKPCTYKAKRDGYCLTHWKKRKRNE